MGNHVVRNSFIKNQLKTQNFGSIWVKQKDFLRQFRPILPLGLKIENFDQIGPQDPISILFLHGESEE
jgi:hypothetical protein